MNTKINKKAISHRLKIIAGQVNGISKMIEEDKYCIDILTQSLAIEKVLKEEDKEILNGHLATCTIDQIKSGEEKKATEELVKIFSLNGKF